MHSATLRLHTQLDQPMADQTTGCNTRLREAGTSYESLIPTCIPDPSSASTSKKSEIPKQPDKVTKCSEMRGACDSFGRSNQCILLPVACDASNDGASTLHRMTGNVSKQYPPRLLPSGLAQGLNRNVVSDAEPRLLGEPRHNPKFKNQQAKARQTPEQSPHHSYHQPEYLLNPPPPPLSQLPPLTPVTASSNPPSSPSNMLPLFRASALALPLPRCLKPQPALRP